MAIERRHADPDKTIRGNGRYYPPYGGVGTGKRGQPDLMLWRFMEDIRYEPDWRREAEVDMAFYDGDQLKTETLRRMKEFGIPPIVVNMIKPIIKGVTGFEAIARAGLKCIPEDGPSYEIAKAFNVKFKEALRLTDFDRAVSKAFACAAKIGVGWLEVVREQDPFKYPYRVEYVPWREIFADYQSRKEDYSDARYIIRRKWYDAEVLKGQFPDKEMMIDGMAGGFTESIFSEWESAGYDDLSIKLMKNLDQEQRFTLDDAEWRNTTRKRIALYEVVYNKVREVECVRMPNGVTVEFDQNSQAQLQALASGQVQFIIGPTKTWHQAVYMGPHQISDRELEFRHSHYIPVVCDRKDNDGSPYGIIRDMRSPQESYNARQTRGLYDISSRRYLIDDDAVDNHDETSKELNKVNAYIVLRGERMGEGITAMPTTEMTPAVVALMAEAKRNIYEATGVQPEFLGQVQSAGQSGVAIDQLIYQTQQVLGTFVDNYRSAKEMAGNALFRMIFNDFKDQENIAIESEEEPRKQIILNGKGPAGERTNDVLVARMRVALGEVPESKTYMQQNLQSLAEIVKSMPPEIQPAFAHLIVKAHAPADQEEILGIIRQITGFGPEPTDPEKREQMAQQKAAQEAMQQRATEAEIALQEAEVENKRAEALEKTIRAQKLEDADTDLTEAKTLVELAKAGDVETESKRKERETQAKIVEASARLEKERNMDRQKKEAASAKKQT